MKRILCVALVAAALLCCATPSFAQQPPQRMEMTMDGIGTISAPIQVVVLLTLLSFVPAILMTMTSFTRIVIVFHFLRQAMGTQEVPSNQILVGLALFLTMFIMAPVGAAINDRAVQPAMAGKITTLEAIDRATPPLRDFMLRQTRESDLVMFLELSKMPRPAKPELLPMRVVIPAYVMSEIKTGFQMGFFVFVPFLLIDLVVSTSLLSMGMMQLPPAMISLPFKLVLFVTVDGWSLVVKSLVRSFV
ncbi:MAG: flagellar type III secretion system pore protein FliP [Acidobacteria bacterium]|jgi:flagellar biosynthetic protein FliP|nr:flagellar type III secretion system pore protein FliP [Acidobacteriota bacterium]